MERTTMVYQGGDEITVEGLDQAGTEVSVGGKTTTVKRKQRDYTKLRRCNEPSLLLQLHGFFQEAPKQLFFNRRTILTKQIKETYAKNVTYVQSGLKTETLLFPSFVVGFKTAGTGSGVREQPSSS